MKGGWVYMTINRPGGVLYIGVTADLLRRASEHRAGDIAGSTQRYGLKRFEDISEAITRERVLKKWRRAWKDELIAKVNPAWDDLYTGIL